MPQELLSTPELCAVVGITDRTIRRWIARRWIDPDRVEQGDSHAYIWKPRDLAVAKRLKHFKPVAVERKRRFELALGLQ